MHRVLGGLITFLHTYIVDYSQAYMLGTSSPSYVHAPRFETTVCLLTISFPSSRYTSTCWFSTGLHTYADHI